MAFRTAYRTSAFLAVLVFACATSLPAKEIVTADDVIPILQRRCVICHGGSYRDGELDLRTVVSIKKGGKSGSAIKVGNADESLLIKKIASDEMPPSEDRGRAGIEITPADELETLKEWINDGAEGRSPLAKTKSVTSDLWSLQPVKRPKPPEVSNSKVVANPIDAFLLRDLGKSGLSYSEPASRDAVLRRLALGTTGLPPTPEAMEAVESKEMSHADLVDRYLASPRYGERWARFWLDLAGYADSEGKRQADMIRKYAWKYRDYVIRSFNEDKPYDRFLIEQIAGDELADYSDGNKITRAIYDNLVATGFMRMAPDGTTANPVNRVRDRIDVIADQLDVLTRGVMGLTMDCARCHDHKYDPVSQRDYYRLAAIFKGAFDEYDWLTPQKFSNQWKKVKYRQLPVALPEDVSDWKKRLAEHKKKVEVLDAKVKKANAAKAGNARDLRKQLTALKAAEPPEPMIRALWDRGRPTETYVYRRGDHLLAAERVDPGVPAAIAGDVSFQINKPWEGATQTGRRLAFAKWLTDKRHPLTARVMVNRIWKHHFGTGLVKSLDNFGKTGTGASHPELLDWLAGEFMDNDWSVKHVHRLILNSTAWRQTSRVSAGALREDPENRLISRMPMMRMDAEQVHDSLLQVAGALEVKPFGEPDQVTVRGDGLVTANGKDGKYRRSIFVRQRRKEMPTMLETFDLPQMNPSCIERMPSTVVTQPLHLLNNAFVHDLAASFARRVEQSVQGTDARIRTAYRLAFTRSPSTAEMNTLRNSLTSLERYRESVESNEEGAPNQLALVDFCHTLLNSAAFLYID